MKSTAKAQNSRKPSKALPARRGRVVTIDGVRIRLPGVSGTPKNHTEEEIRAAVRDYFKTQRRQ